MRYLEFVNRKFSWWKWGDQKWDWLNTIKDNEYRWNFEVKIFNLYFERAKDNEINKGNKIIDDI